MIYIYMRHPLHYKTEKVSTTNQHALDSSHTEADLFRSAYTFSAEMWVHSLSLLCASIPEHTCTPAHCEL